MDEQRAFRFRFGDVMVNHHPVRLVHARLEGEIRDPGGFFTQVALLPVIVMKRLQPHVCAEEMFGQPLQQRAGEKTVQVAFVGDDDFRLGQREHGGRLN